MADGRWSSNSIFERGRIPLSALVPPPSPPLLPPSRFPRLYDVGRHVWRLEIDSWNAPTWISSTSVSMPISPHTLTYDIWKGALVEDSRPQAVQLWIGSPAAGVPFVSVNAALASLLTNQMPNLRSFWCVPAQLWGVHADLPPQL